MFFAMNYTPETIQLRRDREHYWSELRTTTDPRDMRVLIEFIATIEERLRDLQASGSCCSR